MTQKCKGQEKYTKCEANQKHVKRMHKNEVKAKKKRKSGDEVPIHFEGTIGFISILDYSLQCLLL